ncbi:MAG: hypothetical protein MI921_11470 [Cytophagales bacterium]|nr:hypothetical protein [Cytophagales bacterium]
MLDHLRPLAPRVIGQLYDAFVQHYPDERLICDAMRSVYPLDTIDGPMDNGIIDVRTSFCRSSATLALSAATCRGDKWHADVVAIVNGQDRWIESGAALAHDWSLEPWTELDYRNIIVLGAASSTEGLTDGLEHRGYRPLRASNPIRFFRELMRGAALVAPAGTVGSNPLAYLALRQSNFTMEIRRTTPWDMFGFTDYHAEAQRARRRPFASWNEPHQLAAIRDALMTRSPV